MKLHAAAGAPRPHRPRLPIVVTLVILGLLCSASTAARRRTPPPEPAVTVAPDAPVVRDTRANLQSAFGNEMNAKARYTAWAQRADAEGCAAVANLFRACATAESIHAHQHVIAIAWQGGTARAVLDRVQVGSTDENLRAAVSAESYEVATLYPALLERARAEHRPAAVRSMTFALASERDHLRLLEAALAGLEAKPVAQAIYVCRCCGRTLASRPAHKCPNCFTPSGRFLKIG